MTPEKLLKPRYKVIADYPSNPRSVGFVFELVHEQSIGVFDNYPHLFKKLAWYEERIWGAEFPFYLKVVNEYISIPKGAIVEVEKYVPVPEGDKYMLDKDAAHFWVYLVGHENRFNLFHFEPATETEYLEFKKQNKP